MPVRPNQPFVGALSTRASSDPSKGHYYWFYRTVHDFQINQGESNPTVIGPIHAVADFILPFFNKDLHRLEFRLNPFVPFLYRFKDLERKLAKRLEITKATYFVYDGGLSDYWIVYGLALKFPQIIFVYNFHWADQWLALIESRRVSAVVVTRVLRSSLSHAPQNLRLSAETQVFASKLETLLRTNFEVFPIFSGVSNRAPTAWRDRPTEVLFLPQRYTELDFVARASQALKVAGLSAMVALRRDTWARWGNQASKDLLGDPTFLPLDEEAYGDLLFSSRVVVLPYNKPYFQWGSSGKFNEAIRNGCFPLVPAGTAISSQSSGPPREHEFVYGDEKSLVIRVQKVLNRDTPSHLSAVSVSDFISWMHCVPTSRSSSPLFTQRIIHLALLLTASLYREKSPWDELVRLLKLISYRSISFLKRL